MNKVSKSRCNIKTSFQRRIPLQYNKYHLIFLWYGNCYIGQKAYLYQNNPHRQHTPTPPSTPIPTTPPIHHTPNPTIHPTPHPPTITIRTCLVKVIAVNQIVYAEHVESERQRNYT